MSFITLKNINKSFNGEPVLKDINLTIEEGSTLGILGRSGSGKSVLINMLRGTKEYAPDSGQVLFDLAICENKNACMLNLLQRLEKNVQNVELN
jgi:methyl coenzyme M reductase system subunit A2